MVFEVFRTTIMSDPFTQQTWATALTAEPLPCQVTAFATPVGGC